jgi:transcriptional regulator with XRE-family HTH domain
MAPRREPQAGLGAAIREQRKRLGLSQEELADRADTHPTWISHLESGRKNPAWGTVERIARALEIKVSDLATRAEELEN